METKEGSQTSYILNDQNERGAFSGPFASYFTKIRAGDLHQDSHQQKVVERLQVLHEQLVNYNPDVHTKSWISKVGALSRKRIHEMLQNILRESLYVCVCYHCWLYITIYF